MRIYTHIIIVSMFLIISGQSISWATGNNETGYIPQPTYNTNPPDNSNENAELIEESALPVTAQIAQITKPITPRNISLKYSYIMSNEGMLYRFYTDTSLPEQTSIANITIRNFTSSFDHSLKKTVVLNNNANFFEYIISPEHFVFLPLLPYIIEISYLDQKGTLLGFSQTKFEAVLSFTTKKSTSYDFMVSDPIALSDHSLSFKEYQNRKETPLNAPTSSAPHIPTESLPFFSNIYISTDDNITGKLFSQLKTSIENYNNDNNTKKYILITGISHSNQISPDLYQKMLNKVNILRDQLYTFDKKVFMQNLILVDVLLIFDNSHQYDNALYNNKEQVIFSISSSEQTLKRIQDQHNQKNLAFIQIVNNNLYQQYSAIPSRLLLAKNNIVNAHTYYYAAQKLIKESRIESYISKTEQIQYAIDAWLYESKYILASLQNTKLKLANINRDEINTSIEDVKESMDSLGIEDSALYANVESLKLNYDDTYSRITAIENEYIRKRTDISQHKNTIISLQAILKNYLIPYNSAKNKIDHPDNIALINKLYIYIDELISLYESLENVLYENTNTAPIEISKVYTNLQKSDAILETIENTLITITNEIMSYSLIKNADIIIYQVEKDAYSRQENISNGISNIISASEFLKIWNNATISLIKTVKKADSINATLLGIESDANRIFLSTSKKTIADYNYQKRQANENAQPSQSNVYLTKSTMSENTDAAPRLNFYTDDNAPAPKLPATLDDDMGITFDTFNEELIEYYETTEDTAAPAGNRNRYAPSPEVVNSPQVMNNPQVVNNPQVMNSPQVVNNPQVTNSPEVTNTPTQSNTMASSDTRLTRQYDNEYALLSDGKLNQGQIVRYITARTQNTTVNIPTLVNTYMREAEYEGINADIAIAQMLYVTDMMNKKKFFSANNPGGLGGPSSQNWELYPFQDLKTGIRAHIQHIKSYVVNAQFSQEIVDPRYDILANNKLVASAQNLRTLTQSWYPYNTDAYARIVGIIEDMYRYSNIR